MNNQAGFGLSWSGITLQTKAPNHPITVHPKNRLIKNIAVVARFLVDHLAIVAGTKYKTASAIKRPSAVLMTVATMVIIKIAAIMQYTLVFMDKSLFSTLSIPIPPTPYTSPTSLFQYINLSEV